MGTVKQSAKFGTVTNDSNYLQQMFTK